MAPLWKLACWIIALSAITVVNSFCPRPRKYPAPTSSTQQFGTAVPEVLPQAQTQQQQEEIQVNGNAQKPTKNNNNEEEDVFTTLAIQAATCLFQSDLKRDAINQKSKGAVASGATNWIDDASAFYLRQALDKVKLKLPDERKGLDRDEASSWIRWMKASPTPMIINLSDDLREVANRTVVQENNIEELLDQTPSDFLSRIGCRLIILPSGAALEPLSEAPGSMIYGKLLFGGVTRYRLLNTGRNNNNKPPRRAGERTEVKPSSKDKIPAWIQYGGPERMYEAVDMGPAALLEVVVMPLGQKMANVMGNNMVLARIVWKPQQMFSLVESEKTSGNSNMKEDKDMIRGYTPVSLSGRERNEAFQSDFRSSVGGLQPQINAIVRRVLDGRVIRPAEEGAIGGGQNSKTTTGDSTTTELALAAMEAEELALLGLTPVRGLLLYGPPGTGKTLLAREISRSLRARAPKIVSAPELLDRWVGGSEKLVRALFADAESELAACNGDSTKSALHVIVIDEIDAVFRKRSSAEDSGEATRSSVVNQILAKLDGVNSIPNVLLIGMTNRRELLDEALLRPGRLEVQIEVPLPDKEGR